MHAQAEATRVCEREILRLVDKYGIDTIKTAFDEVQDYVERLTRQRVAELPDGELGDRGLHRLRPRPRRGPDPDPGQDDDRGRPDPLRPDGLAPGGRLVPQRGLRRHLLRRRRGHEDVLPRHPAELGLLPGRHRSTSGPRARVVNAPWPIAVTGFCSGPVREDHELDLRALVAGSCRSGRWPCSFNLEYLLVGGRDVRHPRRPYFMWYDWMVGGWGGRNGRDGSTATAPIFGVGLAVQPLEGQERLCPVLTSGHEIVTRLAAAPDAGAAAAASRRAAR